MCCKKVGKFEIDGIKFCKDHVPSVSNFDNKFKRFIWNKFKGKKDKEKEVEYILKNGSKIKYVGGRDRDGD